LCLLTSVSNYANRAMMPSGPVPKLKCDVVADNAGFG